MIFWRVTVDGNQNWFGSRPEAVKFVRARAREELEAPARLSLNVEKIEFPYEGKKTILTLLRRQGELKGTRQIVHSEPRKQPPFRLEA